MSLELRFHVVAGGVSWLADSYAHAVELALWYSLVYGEALIGCRTRTISGLVS